MEILDDNIPTNPDIVTLLTNLQSDYGNYIGMAYIPSNIDKYILEKAILYHDTDRKLLLVKRKNV